MMKILLFSALKHQQQRKALAKFALNKISIMSSSTNKFRIFVAQSIPHQAAEILSSNHIEMVVSEKMPSREKLLQSVADVDALFCTLNEKIDQEVLDRAGSRLKVVATCSVGYEHIDLKECARRNIPVGYTPGVLTG